MQEERVQYHKLPGRARRHFGLVSRQRQRLWLAEDHLLCVWDKAYSERYKRFYLSDIQAISICPTGSGRVANALLAAAALIFVVLTVSLLDSAGDAWAGVAVAFLGVLVLSFVLALGLNILFGPTCACFLYTAVHTERLACLGRLRTAQKVVTRLRPAIEEAQGRFSARDAALLAQRQGLNETPAGSPAAESSSHRAP